MSYATSLCILPANNSLTKLVTREVGYIVTEVEPAGSSYIRLITQSQSALRGGVVAD